MAELNLLLGWLPDYSLKQPARRTFLVLRSSREIKERERARFFYDMVSVATCAQASNEWIDKLKTYYFERSVPPRTQVSKGISNKDAYAALKAQLALRGVRMKM